MRKHDPDVYAKIAHILLPKDFIRFKLTGEYATDLAGAAGTLLLNVARREWSSEVVDALGIPAEWLPPVHEGPQVTGVVSAAAAEETGLRAGTPVVGGGGDQAAQATGVGAVEPGIVALTVGTSGVVFAPLASYAYEPDGRLHAFCHAVPGHWHFMGVMLSAAGSLQWYRDTLCPGEEFGPLTEEAADPARCRRATFLLYLTGAHASPRSLRSAFVGLTSRHTRKHMTRAVLEGVAFGLRTASVRSSRATQGGNARDTRQWRRRGAPSGADGRVRRAVGGGQGSRARPTARRCWRCRRRGLAGRADRRAADGRASERVGPGANAGAYRPPTSFTATCIRC